MLLFMSESVLTLIVFPRLLEEFVDNEAFLCDNVKKKQTKKTMHDLIIFESQSFYQSRNIQFGHIIPKIQQNLHLLFLLIKVDRI